MKIKTTSLTMHKRGIGALILLTFFWGLLAVSIRYLSFHFSLFQHLYLTIGLGFLSSLILFPRSLTFQKIKNIPKTDWAVMISRALIGFVIGATLYRESIALTKISNVTFLQAIPFAALFGVILFKEKLNVKKSLYLVIAYLGVLLIAIKDLAVPSSFGKGELFSLISGACFSFSYVLRKWQTEYLDNKEITQILLFIGTLALLLISILVGEGVPNLNINLILVGALVLTGVFNTLNIFLINYGFKNVSAILASNILTLESIFGMIFAFIFYKEMPILKEIVGGLFILLAVTGMNSADKKQS